MNIYLFPLDSLDSPPVLLAMDDDDDGGGSVTADSFPTVYINLSPECPRGGGGGGGGGGMYIVQHASYITFFLFSVPCALTLAPHRRHPRHPPRRRLHRRRRRRRLRLLKNHLHLVYFGRCFVKIRLCRTGYLRADYVELHP